MGKFAQLVEGPGVLVRFTTRSGLISGATVHRIPERVARAKAPDRPPRLVLSHQSGGAHIAKILDAVHSGTRPRTTHQGPAVRLDPDRHIVVAVVQAHFVGDQGASSRW